MSETPTSCDCRINYREEIVYCPLHNAAPDMLEALELAVSNWQVVHELTEISGFDDHWVNIARRAIAKAKGEI